MLLRNSTYEAQSSLAAYCRTGVEQPIPGVDRDRVPHYRRLVFNIIEDNLQTAYPLTHDLLSQEEWEEVVTEFFSNHPCQSPQIWSMPNEFYQYLREVNHPLLEKHPFLGELLLFEWKEIELYMSEDKKIEYAVHGDLTKDKLVLNPEFQLIHLSWPVHLMNANEIKPEVKGSYFLMLNRDPESGKIIFTNLSHAFVRMIEYLDDHANSVTGLLDKIGKEMQVAITEDIRKATLDFFSNGLKNRLILGFNEPMKEFTNN